MTEKIFLIEDWDCNYTAFDTLRGAVEYAEEAIAKSGNSDEEKILMYRELISTLLNDDIDGFSLDEFMWCWTIDLHTSKSDY